MARGAKVRGQPQVFGNFTTVCSTLTLPVLQGVAYTLIVCTYRGSLEADDTELDWELTGSLSLREPPMPLTLLLTALLRDEAEAARGAEQRRRAVFLARLQASSPGSTNREAWEDLQVASALVDAARAECRARGKAFDDGWSGTPAALGEGWPKGGKKAVWARFEQLAPHPAVFEGGYGLSDVRQGQLGDCYFCADMANLAGCLGQRLEGALDMLLVTAEANPEGVYCVRLWVGGRWQHFLLDDRLPCAPDAHSRLELPGTTCSGPPNPAQGRYFSLLAVSSSNLNVMWPCLLEKAWARLHGSYAAIDADARGDLYSPLNYFLPHSLRHVQHTLPLLGDTGQGEMWNNLLLWYSMGWPMTAGSRKAGVVGGGGSQGINRRHAYSIMRLVGPHGSNSVGKRLIQLRDPWGKGGWGGRFGCKDTASWTPALQAATGHDPRASRDDGSFWIPLADFLIHFDCVNVTRNIQLAKDGGRWHMAVVRGTFVDAKTDWLKEILASAQVLIHIDREACGEFNVSLELDRRSRKEGAKHPETVLYLFINRSGSGDTPIKLRDLWSWNWANQIAKVEQIRGMSATGGSVSLTQKKIALPPGCSLVAIPTVSDLRGWKQASYTLNVTFEAKKKKENFHHFL